MQGKVAGQNCVATDTGSNNRRYLHDNYHVHGLRVIAVASGTANPDVDTDADADWHGTRAGTRAQARAQTQTPGTDVPLLVPGNDACSMQHAFAGRLDDACFVRTVPASTRSQNQSQSRSQIIQTCMDQII